MSEATAHHAPDRSVWTCARATWWRRTFIEVLVKQAKYRFNPYDRCLLTLGAESREGKAKTRGVIIVEVDGVFEAGDQEHQRLMSRLESTLKFGKAVELQKKENGTAYACRCLKQLADFSVEHSMTDYIMNRIKPVDLKKMTVTDAKDAILDPTEEAQ